jgi:DNA-binding MarR family transcriptional regulator
MNASRNSDPVEALDTVFELAVRLTDAMQRGLGERGLNASRAEALLVLDRGGAIVQRQLGEALRCTPRYVTAIVDDLEAEGLVRRERHPTDRRATLVVLTEAGAAAAARMIEERRQAAQWLLGDVGPRSLSTFVSVARQVLDRIGAATPIEPSPGARQGPSNKEEG